MQSLPHAQVLLRKEWLPDYLVTPWRDPNSPAHPGPKTEKEMLHKVISETLGKPVIVSEDGDEKQNILLFAPQRQCFC